MNQFFCLVLLVHAGLDFLRKRHEILADSPAPEAVFHTYALLLAIKV